MTPPPRDVLAGGAIQVPRRTTLSEALDHLRPVFEAPLCDDRGHDWWQPLKIELLTQTQAVLDLRRFVSEAELPRVRVTTSRPLQWQGVGDEVAISRWATLVAQGRAMASPARGDVLKSRGIDLNMRRIATKAPRRELLPKAANLFVIEVPTPSMCNSLLAVADGDALAVTADHRAHRLAQARHVPVTSIWSVATNRLVDHRGLSRRAMELLRKHDPSLAQALRMVVPGNLRVLTTDFARLREIFVKVEPNNVVLASDQHRYGVLSSWASAELGVRSVVLQHGLTADEAGYLPLRADIFAAFGSQAVAWMTSRGVSRSRVHVVGSPRLGDPQEAVVTGPADSPVRTVLVPMQPVDSPAEACIVQCALSALVARNWLMRIRLHPGDAWRQSQSDEEIKASLGIPDAADVEVERQGGLAESLRKATLVLGHASTVIGEAAALGVPTAIYTEPSMESPFAESGLPEFSTAEDLSRVAGQLSASPADFAGQVHVAAGRLIAATGQRSVAMVHELLSRPSSSMDQQPTPRLATGT